MKKSFVLSAFLSYICILNSSGNSLYLLDYTDQAAPHARHIHISYRNEKPDGIRQLEEANNKVARKCGFFEGLHKAYSKKKHHPNDNLHFHFWQTAFQVAGNAEDIHEAATKSFILKVNQVNPLPAVNFQRHLIG